MPTPPHHTMQRTTDADRQSTISGAGPGVAPLLLASLLLGGCAFTIVPQSKLDDPVQVFVVDHGWHASLVLPYDSGTVRYSYGDWQWYAQRQTGPASALRALLTDNQAALARRLMPVPATAEAVGQALHARPGDVLFLDVEHRRMTALRRRLESIFAANSSTLHRDADNRTLAYVHHPEPYSLGHNSNAVVAQWLRDMGADVRGAGPFSRWRLAEE